MTNKKIIIQGLLQRIKFFLECNNESFAERIIEQFVFDQEEENGEILEVLEELVSLKKWKEEFGKDEWYLQKQPIAWNNAKKVLEKAKI